MKSVNSCFTALAFLLFAIGGTVLAYFFAKTIFVTILSIVMLVSYIVALVFLGFYLCVLLSTGRTNSGASFPTRQHFVHSLYKEYKTPEECTPERCEEIREKEYNSSMNFGFFALTAWLTPALGLLHPDLRFMPFSVIAALAIITGFIWYVRMMVRTYKRYDSEYKLPIPAKATVGSYLFTLVLLLTTTVYYIALFLVATGVFNAATFATVLR